MIQLNAAALVLQSTNGVVATSPPAASAGIVIVAPAAHVYLGNMPHMRRANQGGQQQGVQAAPNQLPMHKANVPCFRLKFGFRAMHEACCTCSKFCQAACKVPCNTTPGLHAVNTAKKPAMQKKPNLQLWVVFGADWQRLCCLIRHKPGFGFMLQCLQTCAVQNRLPSDKQHIYCHTEVLRSSSTAAVSCHPKYSQAAAFQLY